MSVQQKGRQIALLYVITALEAMGDLLDKQCMCLVHRKRRQPLSFSPEGWQDLLTALRSVLSHASTIAHVVQEDLSVQEDMSNAQSDGGGAKLFTAYDTSLFP